MSVYMLTSTLSLINTIYVYMLISTLSPISSSIWQLINIISKANYQGYEIDSHFIVERLWNENP